MYSSVFPLLWIGLVTVGVVQRFRSHCQVQSLLRFPSTDAPWENRLRSPARMVSLLRLKSFEYLQSIGGGDVFPVQGCAPPRCGNLEESNADKGELLPIAPPPAVIHTPLRRARMWAVDLTTRTTDKTITPPLTSHGTSFHLKMFAFSVTVKTRTSPGCVSERLRLFHFSYPSR